MKTRPGYRWQRNSLERWREPEDIHNKDTRPEVVEDTEKVIDFLEHVDLDMLAQAGTWANLNAICLVHPEEDILPIGAKFGQLDASNTGINYTTSKEPVWYTLSDVVASKLLTGRNPHIEKAIRFIPRGVQRNLQAIRMIGGREINPYSDDLYLALMEHRDHLKQERDRHDMNSEPEVYNHLDITQKAVKIITNATAYGIYIEVNTSPSDRKQVTATGSWTIDMWEPTGKGRILPQTFKGSTDAVFSLCLSSNYTNMELSLSYAGSGFVAVYLWSSLSNAHNAVGNDVGAWLYPAKDGVSQRTITIGGFVPDENAGPWYYAPAGVYYVGILAEDANYKLTVS